MRTRVKICGLTRPEDVEAAVEAGADALGFMFHPESPRRLTVGQAAALVRRVPPFVARVGVFGDPTEALVREVVAACGIDTLQFHGGESPEFCGRFAPLPIYKGFRVRDRSVLEELPCYETAGWLLDSYVPGRPGGTGAAFNWALAIEAGRLGRPLILAGGLTPENVEEAVRRVRPYAVDVSSGVESSPGCKDPVRMRAFVAAVWGAGWGDHESHE